MTAWFGPLLALAAGWGAHRLVSPRSDLAERIVGSTVLGIAITASWLFFLDLAGIRWRWPFLLLPALAGTAAAVWPAYLTDFLLRPRRRPPLRRCSRRRRLRRAYSTPRQRLGINATLTDVSAVSPRKSVRNAGWSRRGESRPQASELGVFGGPWPWLAAGAVALRAALVVAQPAFGWDFRYIWGLKARVFALAGAHDLSWLGWHSFAFAHPDYPPLWSDLIADGALFGAPVGQVAAAWAAVLVVGIGAACWRLARPAGAPAATLAAIAGAWTPILLAPSVHSSGSAEPLVAFLLAASIIGLLKLSKNSAGLPVVLVAGLAALGVTKHEGTVMALLLAVVSLRLLHRRWMAPFLAGILLPVTAWHVTVAAAGIPRLPAIFDLARMASRAMALPAAVLRVMTPVLALELCVIAVFLLCKASRTGRSFQPALWVWLAILALAYLTSANDLQWHLATSLQRVLAPLLPAVLGLLLARTPLKPTSQTPI